MYQYLSFCGKGLINEKRTTIFIFPGAKRMCRKSVCGFTARVLPSWGTSSQPPPPPLHHTNLDVAIAVLLHDSLPLHNNISSLNENKHIPVYFDCRENCWIFPPLTSSWSPTTTVWWPCPTSPKTRASLEQCMRQNPPCRSAGTEMQQNLNHIKLF